MPSNKQISGWLLEAATLSMKTRAQYVDAGFHDHAEKLYRFAKKYLLRSNLVESMRCETCRWWERPSTEMYALALGDCMKEYAGVRDLSCCANITHSGPNFYCCHWEGKNDTWK
jgi:hypothetical protein